MGSTLRAKLHRRILRIIAQTASLPAQMVWGLTKPFFIDQSVLFPRYQKALRAHKPQLPTLAWNDTQIVQTLERDGICITSLTALNLPNTSVFLQSSQRIAQDLKQIATQLNDPPHEIHGTKEHLMSEPELFTWGLNQRLLEIIETYLGLPVAYDGVSCFLSVPNGKEIGARAWHRDREDRRMVKVCVYLNDVNEDGGPFQCLTSAFNDLVCRSVKYRYKSIFDPEMAEFSASAKAQANEIVSCTGPAGTVIFVDTARFYHRGKPPTQCPRTAVFFSYFSRRPWHPFFCQRTPLSQKETHQLTQELSDPQKACVHWHKALPMVAKLIPKSRI
jgi:hypothetical protein